MSIDSFERHGADFWNPQGAYRTLHEINPARLRFIEHYLPLAGKTILDIGCGGGILSEALAERGARVRGIDLSASVLQAAEAHRPAHLKLDYRHQSSADCVRAGEQYDAVMALEILEHVEQPMRIIEDAYALLKPQGLAFFSTLNRNLAARWGAVFLAERVLKWIPQGTHDPDLFIKPQELVRMSERVGFQALALSGLHYHPLRRSASLSPKIGVNYLYVARKEV